MAYSGRIQPIDWIPDSKMVRIRLDPEPDLDPQHCLYKLFLTLPTHSPHYPVPTCSYSIDCY